MRRPSTSTLAMLLIVGGMACPAVAEGTRADAPASLAARPRVRVDDSGGDKTDIRDFLDTVVEAANAEDLETFSECFTGASRSKMRKQAALRFVQHDVAMDLLDTQVVKKGKTMAEVAVRYRVVLSDDTYDVVSLVAVKQENGYWKITSEKIQSYEHQSPRMCSPSRYACLGGTCQLVARR